MKTASDPWILVNLCRLPRIEVRGYLSESATEAERLLEKMKDSKWLCWFYRVIWELHWTAVSRLHTSIKTNICRMHQKVCTWKVTDVEGPTETLTHETVVWFAHIECNGDRWHVFGWPCGKEDNFEVSEELYSDLPWSASKDLRVM